MTTEAMTVIGGVDTHKHTHYAAVIDEHGRLLGHREFPATDAGYKALLSWMRHHGNSPSHRGRKHRVFRRDPDPVS